MITTIIFDFANVLLFAKGSRPESINALHQDLSKGSQYQVLDHFVLNADILEFVKKNQDKFNFYIFTNSQIQDEPEIRQKLDPLFKKIYTVSNLGFPKDDPRSFEQISKEIKESKENILFVDDTQEYIETARAAGLRAILFESNKQLFEEIKQFTWLRLSRSF